MLLEVSSWGNPAMASASMYGAKYSKEAKWKRSTAHCMGPYNMSRLSPLEDLLRKPVFAWVTKFSKCTWAVVLFLASGRCLPLALSLSALVCRNGVDVEGASHKQVVDLIKHSADELRLVGKKKKKRPHRVFDLEWKQSFSIVVIASAGDETHSDIHSGEESSGSSNDYSERRSLAITIPDYSVLEVHDEKFYVSVPDCISSLTCHERPLPFLSEQMHQVSWSSSTSATAWVDVRARMSYFELTCEQCVAITTIASINSR